MKPILLVTATLALGLGACTSVPPRPSADLRIAITIDDLPVHGPHPASVTPNQANAEMIAALTAAGVPAFTFVNAASVERQPDTESALANWHEKGFPLGNHTWSHRHLSEMSVAEFESEVVKNEPTLSRYGGNSDWRWFRYPFLDEGESPEKRVAARQVLAKHGYRVAGVTMSFSDWQWTAPYTRCLTAGNKAAVAEMEELYLRSARENIAASRDTAQKLYGRDIPYVLLMHVGAMSAHMMPKLLKLYHDAGFRFVTLEEAERDPVYKGYTDLSLAPPVGEFEQARIRGIQLSPAPDYSARLGAMCPGSGPTVPIP